MINDLLSNATAESTWNGWILIPEDVKHLLKNADRILSNNGTRSYFKPDSLVPNAGDALRDGIARPDNITTKTWLRLA